MYTYKANGNYTQEILENGNVLRTFETDVAGVYILAEYTMLKCGATLTAHYSLVAAKTQNFQSRKSIKNDPIHGTYEMQLSHSFSSLSFYFRILSSFYTSIQPISVSFPSKNRFFFILFSFLLQNLLNHSFFIPFTADIHNQKTIQRMCSPIKSLQKNREAV